MNPGFPEHEISDTLAQEFLRDRDIRCPRCIYPLRNATSPICPECGCAFALRPYDPQETTSAQKVMRFGLLVMTLIAIGRVVVYSAQFIRFSYSSGYRPPFVYGLMFYGGYIIWTVMMVYLLTLWIRSCAKRAMTHRVFLISTIIFLVIMLSGSALQTLLLLIL